MHAAIVGDEALEVAAELARRRDVNGIKASEHARIEPRGRVEHRIVQAKQSDRGEHAQRAFHRGLALRAHRTDNLHA